MSSLIATIKNDWRLLLSDKVGLLILFILPMCLVTFVSETQSGMFEAHKTIKLLVINRDKGATGKAIVNALKKSDSFAVTKAEYKNLKKYERQVALGEFQGLLIIPSNVSQRVREHSRHINSHIKTDHFDFYVDPAIPPNTATALKLSLNYMLQKIQMNVMQKVLAQATRQRPDKTLSVWFDVSQHYASLNGKIQMPNSVQQNVPAWTLFGMFFIVVPLAGLMVQERSQGVIQRLRVSPARQSTLLIGRAIAYVVLNLVQLSLMLMIGAWVLPLLNLPALNVADHVGAIYCVGLFASLAATGFGLFMGTWVNSHQQATTVGPFIIVIVAAISGIFVPVYAMPSALNLISAFSPMHWAQVSFLDIFVRGASITQLLPNMAKLLVFFILMIILSVPPVTKLNIYRKYQ